YAAGEEGITVSDEEVEAYYQSMFDYYPNGTPTPVPTAIPFEATPTVTDEQLAVLQCTRTPASEETAVKVTPAAEKKTDPEPTIVPTMEPTPTPYTEKMFNINESYYFENTAPYYSKEFYKNELRYELLENKVKREIESGFPRVVDMVWARHIMVETEKEALEALDRINNGERWEDVAAEVSLDGAEKGGDLGWFTENTMVQSFTDAVFSQKAGTISDPVQTEFGWHLIQVVAHEEHPYTKKQFDDEVDKAYENWLDGYAKRLEIDIVMDLADITPVEPAFAGS
ncbi:MAG: peptidylprolyl isomerase, partial [Anaerolineaceae bacterium]|nr:peptidylprolyl isomerase [Anaerolineaceae bacterium]